MKKRIVLLLIATLSLISCCKEEISAPEKEYKIVATQKSYNHLTGELLANNTVTLTKTQSKVDFYTSDNVFKGSWIGTYSTSGLYESMETFDEDGSLSSKSVHTYDEQNRVTGVMSEFNDTAEGLGLGGYTSDQKFTYNQDGSITATETSEINLNKHIRTKTYYVDAKGRIYKEIEDLPSAEKTVEVLFENDDVTAIKTTTISKTITSSFENINISTKKITLDDQNVIINYGGVLQENSILNSNNSILLSMSLSFSGDDFNTKFTLKEESFSGDFILSTTTYERTFDEEGKVLTENEYDNGKLISAATFSYE